MKSGFGNTNNQRYFRDTIKLYLPQVAFSCINISLEIPGITIKFKNYY